MSKGEETRQRILEQAAGLFNCSGYAGSSLADIMKATGLQKGGIYRHFETKEALAVEAFDYAVERMSDRFAAAIAPHPGAVERLRAVGRVYANLLEDPAVPGGCPIMNTAIEADDGNPVLREHARSAMDRLRAMLRRIVAKGQSRGQVRDAVEPDEVASMLISLWEGGLLLAKLYKDPIHLERATRAVDDYLDRELRPR